jgi:hypothetical protein
MNIASDEVEIRAGWVRSGDRVIGDSSAERIDRLIRGHLRELGRDATGWETLYVDPDDGRLWELIYPHSEMHGGGPPVLRYLSRPQARQKYPHVIKTSPESGAPA